MLTFEKVYGQHIAPADKATAEYIDKLKKGQGFQVNKPRKVRNVDFHRKYFKMLNTIYEGCGVGITFDQFRKSVLISAGFVEFERLFVNGELIERVEAESISFANMDNDRFEEVYNRSVEVCCEMFNLNPDKLNDFL